MLGCLQVAATLVTATIRGGAIRVYGTGHQPTFLSLNITQAGKYCWQLKMSSLSGLWMILMDRTSLRYINWEKSHQNIFKLGRNFLINNQSGERVFKNVK